MAALEHLAIDPGFMTRVCDCRVTRQNKKAQKKQEAAKVHAAGEAKTAPEEESDAELPDVTPSSSQTR